MNKEANSRPINFSLDIVPRVLPFIHKSLNQYGKNSFIWVGPIPRVNIMEPELIRDILSKHFEFQKPKGNPLTRLLATGLQILPAFYLSCSEMMSKWEKTVTTEGSCELDVWPYLETMSSDVISRTAFGSSYEEGRRIFKLQKEQAEHMIQVQRSLYIPGWR
ncbi:hypothetical protein F0562_031137 [Nyssa sinensis]|uniref:Uncharacterized protein n=1 Tax=Nyssa sinensis TaxID=561372 RepID=A0A5J5ASY0_9ASTE|nr:hypothetical protein F0562_031137 [Nyssa sinensis]